MLVSVRVKNVLTPATGYLDGIATHSLNPYVGCAFGRSLCGMACYVQHNRWITKGRAWGSFLEARENTYESYLANVDLARKSAKLGGKPFGIFLSSSTDPFPPQERVQRVTEMLLRAMLDQPPDQLVIQTHSADVANHVDLIKQLADKMDRLRVQVSIECDRDVIEGLPRPAFTVERRLQALKTCKEAGIEAICCVAPLLPIERPYAFFSRVEEAASAVIVDHFIGGDGSVGGARTAATPVPAVMESLKAGSSRIEYQTEIVGIAREVMPGRVGVSRDGFAGRFE